MQKRERLERLRFAALVLDALRPHLGALAREMVPAAHVLEATQAGAVGVLIALEKTKTDRALGAALDGHALNESPVFRRVALDEARREIVSWIERGVFWRRNRAPTKA